MAGLIAILIILIRTAFIVMTITAISEVTVMAIRRSEPPFDPFAPYADILPGQSREGVSARGFNCQFVTGPHFEEICTLTPEASVFATIQPTIAVNTGRISRVVFWLREKTLTVGDLVILWGEPEIAIYSRTANFRWNNVHVVAIPETYDGDFSYWLPIAYVAFESSE
jgi:hypothetical protein